MKKLSPLCLFVFFIALLLQDAGINAQCTSITFQQGNTRASGAVIRSISPTQNYDFTNGWGEFFSSQWTWDAVPGEIRSLLQYNLSQIPKGSVIVSANLSLYADTTGNDGYHDQPTYGTQNASYLEQVTGPWNPDTVTWNTQPTATATNQVLLAQSTNTDENYLNLNVSDIVQGWVNDPSSNYGLLLKMISQNYYNSMIFCSPDYPDSTKWPRLQICYIPVCHASASFTQQNLGNGEVQFTNTSTDSVTQNPGSSSSVIWSDNFNAPSGGSDHNNAGLDWGGNTLTPGGTNEDDVFDITNFWTIDSATMPAGIYGSGNKLYVTNNYGPPYAGNYYYSGDYSDIYDATPNISTIGDSGMTLSFTWRCKGVAGSDYGLVGLSSNGGASFTWLPTHYQGYATCQNALIVIPANYNNIIAFKIAFRFIAGASNEETDPPFEVDNIVLTNNGASAAGNSAFTSHWVFYNGTGGFDTSNATNPVVIFTGQPPYSATLIITDSICSDTLTEVVNMPVNTCTANASFTQQYSGNGEVQFTNTSTDTRSYNSYWVFYNSAGLFASSTATDPLVTFAGNAPYRAYLLIVDSVCSDTASQLVDITQTNCITYQFANTKAFGARITDLEPTTNFNLNTFNAMPTGQWTTGGNPIEDGTLFGFNLSQIPAGSTIISASLSLYADSTYGGGYTGEPTYGANNASYLHFVTTPWNPATVTWNTQPAYDTGGVLLPQSTNYDENYLDNNLLGFVQNWVNNPSTNYGVFLDMITQNYYNSMVFCSPSYADSTKWPMLQVCYISPSVACNANASFTQQNIGSNQVQFTNTSTDIRTYTSNWTFYNASGAFTTSSSNNPLVTFTGQSPYGATLVIADSICSDSVSEPVGITTTNCITFQQGNTQATGAVIRSITPNQNTDFTNGWGEFISSQWTWDGVPGEIRSLLQYNLSQIPPGSVIVSANLSLYADSTAGDGYHGDPTYGSQNASYIEQVTSPWSPTTVSWNTQPTATATNEVLLEQSANTDENYLNLDVSGMVQDWVNNPSGNYGLLLKMISQNFYNSMIFCSPEYPDSTKWPKLEICYMPNASCGIVADFTYQNLGGGVVQFNNFSISDSGYYSSWVFYNSGGIFATSNQENPTVTYSGGEPFYAQLTVSDSIFSQCIGFADSLIIITGQIDTFQTDTLCGFVFNDVNHDGVYDSGDVAASHVPVIVDGAVYYTDATGYYTVSVGAAAHQISVVPPYGWTQTWPVSPNTYSITTSTNQRICGFDFGIANTTTGVNDLGLSSDMVIFPNPLNAASFKILVPDGFETANASVQLEDMLGRQVSDQYLNTQQKLVSVNLPGSLTPGVYIVVLANDTKRLCGRLSVIR